MKAATVDTDKTRTKIFAAFLVFGIVKEERRAPFLMFM